MSFYFPECNAQLQGSAGAVWVNLPTSASFKPANRGCVTGLWVETPPNGYENNATYNILSKGTGYTGGNDGYLRFNQAASTLTLLWKNAGTTYMNTSVTGIPSASRMLVLLIVNAANYHLVVCVPGSSPIVTTVASATPYTTNFSAVDFWSRLGVGSAAAYGHYGPMEEAFFLLGEFPEASNIPDDTLIRNIADGTQELATLDAQLTGTVAKKWRYRMQQQDDLSDAYGIAGTLASVNTTADKVILSGGPLRPRSLRPTPCLALASQVAFGTVGNTATAFADIKTEGGTYSGISPAAIHARLRKEDGTTLVDWQVVDAAPAGGTWAAGQFSGVPYTAGWLTCDFKAVDGGGAQLGDIVSSHGWKGAGFNVLFESQSQGTYLFDTGNGKAIPSTMRAQMIHTNSSGAAWRVKKLSALNSNSRIARGMRQLGIEINTIYPGAPVSLSTVGVQGQSLSAWNTGGAFANMWGDFKAFVGLWQPGYLCFIGHSNPTASYETVLGGVIAKATADVGPFIGQIYAGTARYAGSGTGSSHTDSLNAREGARDRVANNPTTDWWAAHPQVIKDDTGDTGPHPADLDVGQGRHGALLAWGLMGRCKAVEDVPATITGAVKISGGTQLRLVIGPVNAEGASPVALAAGAGTFGLSGGDISVPVGVSLSAADGVLAFTGGGLAVPVAVALQAASATIGLTGGDLSNPAGVTLAAGAASFASTGGGISSPVGVALQAASAVFSLAGGGLAGPLGVLLSAAAALFSMAGGQIGAPVAGLSRRRIATPAQSRNGGITSRG